jgi:hypothetical protein
VYVCFGGLLDFVALIIPQEYSFASRNIAYVLIPQAALLWFCTTTPSPSLHTDTAYSLSLHCCTVLFLGTGLSLNMSPSTCCPAEKDWMLLLFGLYFHCLKV